MTRLPGAVGCAYHECPNEPTHVQFGEFHVRRDYATGRLGGVAWDVCAEHAAKAKSAVPDPRIAERRLAAEAADLARSAERIAESETR